MSTATLSLEQLLETILARPLADRAVIAEVVADSLHPPDPEIEQAILKLARQRLANYDSGKETATPVADVLQEIDEMLKEVNRR
jgi:hypothetical protein